MRNHSSFSLLSHSSLGLAVKSILPNPGMQNAFTRTGFRQLCLLSPGSPLSAAGVVLLEMVTEERGAEEK